MKSFMENVKISQAILLIALVPILVAALHVFKDTSTKAEEMRAREAEEVATRQRRTDAMEVAINECEKAVMIIVDTVTSAATELESSAESMT